MFQEEKIMTNAIRITIIASASVVSAAIIGGIGYFTGKSRATKQLLGKTENELQTLRMQKSKGQQDNELRS